MKQVMLVVSFVLALGILGAAPAAADIQGCPAEVVVGTEGAYPPFNYINQDGELEGFDIDITRALCEEMGAECPLKTQEWSGIIPGLLAKKYDAIIASMSITEERKKKVDFTQKYYQTPARFAGAKDFDVEISKKGLEGLTVGVQRATVSENFLRDNFGDVVEVKSYESQDEATLDLTIGRLDLVIADSLQLRGGFLTTDKGADYEFKGPGFSDERWFGEGIGIAVRPEDDELKECFNKAIEGILADGTYDRISQEHFGMNIYGK